MSQLSLPYSEIANRYYRIDLSFSPPRKPRLPQQNQHNFCFLFLCNLKHWLSCLLHIILCATRRIRVLWLVRKSARVGKCLSGSSVQAKLKKKKKRNITMWKMIWRETHLWCWSSDWSLNWTKSVSHGPPGHWTVLIVKPCNSPWWYFHLLYDLNPFPRLIKAIFRMPCWHEWLIQRNCVIPVAMSEPTNNALAVQE